MLSPSEFYERLLNEGTRRAKTPGPVVWCKQCGRKHRKREACKLFLRTRVVTHADRRGRRAGRKPYRTKRWAP